MHIPDDLSCPGYRAVVLLDRVAGGGAPGRAQNLTFFEVHTDDCAKVVAMRDERRYYHARVIVKKSQPE